MDTLAQFEAEIWESVRISRDELNYHPIRFIQMCEKHGVLGTAKLLLARPLPSDGFTNLILLERTDLSVEHIALKQEFRSLFSTEELENAAEKLGIKLS